MTDSERDAFAARIGEVALAAGGVVHGSAALFRAGLSVLLSAMPMPLALDFTEKACAEMLTAARALLCGPGETRQ